MKHHTSAMGAQRPTPTYTLPAPLAFASVLLVATLLARSAHAAGYFINQESVSGLGRADAGDAAAAEDASTVFYNPAGMTELWENGADMSRNTLTQFGLNIIIPQSRLTDEGSTATTLGTGGLPLTYEGIDATNPGHTAPVPNLYVVQRLFGGAVFAGLGITTPFGLSSQYNSGWFGRYDNLQASLTTINIGPVVAVPINRWLSVGGGIDIQYQSSVLASAIPNSFVPGGPTVQTDGRFDIRGNAWAVGYNLGILIKPTDYLRFGLAYRSAVDHTLAGTATISGFTGPLGDLLNFSTSAKAVSKLPDMETAGVVYQVSKSTALFGEVSRDGWSRVGSVAIQFGNGAPDQTLVQKYRNTFALAIGGEYRWDDALTLRTGFKYEPTPTLDGYRNVLFPDSNRYWLTAGATYRFSNNTSVDFAIAEVLENGTQINVTQSSPALGYSVNVRAKVNSTVTTIGAAFNYRF